MCLTAKSGIMSDQTDPEETQTPASPRRKRHILRWVIPVAAVVVIAGVVGGILISHRASAEPAASTVTREVQASMVTMTDSVTTTGTIAPKQRADLSFTSSGTVTTINVEVGDTVTAGQSLATIDATNLQASVDSAQAAVDAAQSDYDTAVAGGVDARITAAKSTLATKQDSLANAQAALDAATLTAPFDGTVAIVSMAVGDTVGTSGSTGGGAGGTGAGSSTSSSDVITVITTDMYSVSTSVGASDVAKITKGLDVEVTPNGAPTPLTGTVTSVGVIASSTTSAGASFPVTIDITDPQQGLYAGVSASVVIVTSSRQVLAVPTAAITVGPGGTTVEVMTGQTTTTTAVTTGASSNSMTEITSGLNEGDTVVVTTQTGGNATANPGGLSSYLPGGGGRGGRPSGEAGGGFGAGGGFPGGGASGAPGGGTGGFGGGAGGAGGGAGGAGGGAGGTNNGGAGASGGATGGR